MRDRALPEVLAALREVRRRAKLYRRHFGTIPGCLLAVRDRPGASGTMTVRYRDFPSVRVRRGDTDLRTLCHVLGESGYEFPWPADDPPKWIIDAGANSGMAAVYFAYRYPGATVIAIEPDASNFALLEENTSALSNVRCVRAALWTHDGNVDLLDPGQGSWAFRVGDSRESGHTPTVVPAVTVERLLKQFGVDRISLFKIDIEGGEKQVFSESSSWIDRVDAIAIELHDRFQPGCTAVFDQATAAFSMRGTRGEDTFVTR